MYKGIGGSSGYGIGKIVIIKNDMPVYETKSPENKENEIKRFLQAVDKFIEKTTKMAEHMRKTAGEKNAEIIEGHIIMLSDPFMQDEIKDKINSGMCAEEAVDKVCEQFIEMFTMTDDELTVQRAADIKDIRLRLLKILTGDRDIDISEVPKGSIIVAKDLTPSMTAGIVKENVEGIITQAGGFTSHSAILARALEIPGVFSVDDITDNARDGMEAVIDGKEGCVILNPSKEEITEYTAKKEKYLKDKEELNKYRNKATKTADSIEIELFGNIGKPEDAKNVKDNDGEGIGLFRTEFLFMENTQIPSEEEQFEAYKKTAVMMDGKEVIIRTLDVGGDKNIPYLGMEKEDCTVDSLTAALEDGSVTFAGKDEDTDYKALVKSQCGISILSSDILPTEEADTEAKENLLKDSAEKYSTLKIPFIVDRSADEKDDNAKAEWEKAYEAIFVTDEEE